MKRILMVLLLMASCLCLPALAAEEGFTKVAEDGHLILYANPETGDILVEDTRDGYLWRSNPAEPDKKAKGVHKMTLQSQIGIGYTSERGTALTALSKTDSVNRDGFSMAIEEGCVVSTYDFPKQEIAVTIRFSLKDGCLEAAVPVDETRAYGLNTLTSVDVLPAFGAAGSDESGYLFIPDGSGAIIRFNNGVTAMNEYKSNVYGRDPSVTGQVGLSTSPALARTYDQMVRLPVYGVNKGDHGFLAVIAENDSKAVLHARVSNLTSYNYVYSEFQLLNSGSIIMNKKEFDQSITGMSERQGLTGGEYTVRYYFLNGEDESGYVGMAEAYRQYLIAEKGLERRVRADDYPLYLDLFGYVDKTAQFLGIPYQKAVPLTTIADIEGMLDRVGTEGTVVRYRQYIGGNAYGRIPKGAYIQGGLGNSAQMKALGDRLEKGGGEIYPDADLINIYKTGNGFRALFDAVLTPVNSPQMQYQINYGNSKLDPLIAPWYLLSPLKYEFFYQRYLDSYKDLGLRGVSFSALGDVLTADNRTNGIGRQDAQKTVASVVASAGKEYAVMLDGGNAYAAALATHVIESPAESSRYILFDETVPFWQIVFHGYVHYSLSPVNQSGNPDLAALKCLEYGASPLYSLVGRNREQLIDSRMLFLFSADFDKWTDTLCAQYADLSSVLQSLSDREITGHHILSADIRRTDYGDVSVYVNYGDAPADIDGAQIPARGYAVKGGMTE